MKSTVINFEMQDETIVQMTLNYARLYCLRSKSEETYREYNRIVTKGIREEIENAHILYTAYLCANVEHIENCMNKMEFLENMPDDREYVNNAIESLLYPKKKKDSEKRSKRERRDRKTQ